MGLTANPKIKRALVSVSNKDGIVEFCTDLIKDYKVEIISTGGTLKTRSRGYERKPHKRNRSSGS